MIPTLPCACVASATISLSANTSESVSPLSRSEQIIDLPGSKWAGQIDLPAINDLPFAGELRAFLASLRGKSGMFFLPVPGYSDCTGVKTYYKDFIPLADGLTEVTCLGDFPSETSFPSDTSFPSGDCAPAVPAITSLTLNDAVSAGDHTAEIIGLPSWDYSQGARQEYEDNKDQIIKTGAYLQIGNELKLITSDVSITDEAKGIGLVNFEPEIKIAMTAGTVIEFQQPKALVRLLDNSQAAWGISPGQFHDFGLSFVEVI